MKFIKKDSRSGKEIPTSALPDIIFMLLFFFMVTTVMREDELLVENDKPLARQLNKIERKSLVSHIYIGDPRNVKLYGSEPRIQVNDVLIKPDGVVDFALMEKEKLPQADQSKLMMSMEVDKQAAMGIVMDIQGSLRKADTRKIQYAASSEKESN